MNGIQLASVSNEFLLRLRLRPLSAEQLVLAAVYVHSENSLTIWSRHCKKRSPLPLQPRKTPDVSIELWNSLNVTGKNRTDRYWSCERKVKHPDKRSAAYARHKIWKEQGAIKTIYRCKYCRFFHIGSQPKKIERLFERVKKELQDAARKDYEQSLLESTDD